jgi:DNA-binding CsgD family transcriptional regulator
MGKPEPSSVRASIAQLTPDGEWLFYDHSFSADALTKVADQIDGLQTRIKGMRARYQATGIVEVNASEKACKWCPSFKACPAKTALIRTSLFEPTNIEGRLSMMSPSEIVSVFRQHREATDALNRLGTELDSWVQRFGPIDSGDSVIAATESTREYCSPTAAWELAHLTSKENALDHATTTVSKAKGALAKHARSNNLGNQWAQRIAEAHKRERLIVRLRTSGKTFREIAARLGVSAQRVYQVVERIRAHGECP